MNAFNAMLSPIAMRTLRALAPLALLAALSVGAAVLSSFLIRDPAREHLQQIQAAYEAARQIQSRQLAARRTQEALAAVWRIVPARKEFSSVVLAVVDLAQRDGVAIPGMTYSLKTAGDGLALKATMAFQVSGGYASIRRFLHRLETADRYLVVESVDVSRSQNRMSSGSSKESLTDQVSFNVRVVTFLKPEKPVTARQA